MLLSSGTSITSSYYSPCMPLLLDVPEEEISSVKCFLAHLTGQRISLGANSCSFLPC